jgi:hypothetical protein
MPIRVIVGRLARDTTHPFTCLLNNATQAGGCQPCTYMIKPGRRCKLRSCKELDFCWIHLRQQKQVMIHPSRLVAGVGKAPKRALGDGVFARTYHPLSAATLAQLKNAPEGDVLKQRYRVFQTGDVIGEYKGEILTEAEAKVRYDENKRSRLEEFQAPYAVRVETTGQVIDALCQRNFVAYVNDARGTGMKRNTRYTKDGFLEATKDIYQGEELLTSYGSEYWNSRMRDVSHSVVRKNRR